MLWRSKSPADSAVSESDPKNDLAASASQAAGSEWLAGHLNHLTEEQEKKLVEFKNLCEEKKYYTPASADGSVKATHGDATLLRFLRARKFDVAGAWTQFKDTEDWRKENAIEELYENIEVDSYDAARRMYPQWTGHRDRRGIPIYVFEIKHLDSKNMAEYNSTMNDSAATANTHQSSKVPQRLLRLFALYENLLNFVMPLCSQLPRPNMETPIVASTNIVDVSGVGLKQFWNLKGHMQDASVLATAHYPETLDRIFIIGAPAFFPTVWGWIKRWFDPGTTSKIFILSAAEVKPTLSAFMHPSSIPKQYGGDLDWKWGDMPALDDEARALVGDALTTPAGDDAAAAARPEVIKGPVLFKDDHVHILGKVNGESRDKKVPVSNATANTAEHKTDLDAGIEKLDITVEESGDVANGDVEAPTQTVSA